MNVVLYMRYSSDRQTEQSIEGQERVCMEFCKREGYTVVEKYIDRATSAFKDTEKRHEFNRMIKDSDRRAWEAVIVYKLDRFARNRYDAATFKAKLKKNGVRVISATENISDSPEGVILEAVLEGMAEFYSKELSQKITRGMRESAYKTNSVGGSVPLGYKIQGKKYVIDEPAAEIVREAFKRYAEGETVTEICELFNKKGYRTSRGGKFNKNSFHCMFRNERYIGIYTYQDIRIEGGIPAIVDREMFSKVQKMMKQSSKAPARKKATVDYMLAQKLFCGHCGSVMVGECGRSATGRTYYYYSCGNRKKNGSCNKKPLKKDWIEHEVARAAVSLLSPAKIEELADMAIAQNRKDIAADKKSPPLKAEVKDIEKRIKNLFRLVEEGADSPALAQRLSDLEAQKKDCEQRIAEAQSEYIILEKEHVIWWLSKFAGLNDPDDPESRKSIIDLLVNSVTVWDDEDGGYTLTIVYNLTDGNTQTIRLNGRKSSDLGILSPPSEYNPNTFVFFDTFVAYTRQYFTPRR